MFNYLRLLFTARLTLATEVATVLPYETDCNPKQCWRKFKLTPIQIHQGLGQSQAPNSGPLETERKLRCPHHGRGRRWTQSGQMGTTGSDDRRRGQTGTRQADSGAKREPAAPHRARPE